MRKFAIKSAAPSGEGDVRGSDDSGQGWFRKKWRLITLLAIVVIAFVIRFVFAYGISAGDNYALSGGTSASSHLNSIISILSGTFTTTDSALNYPLGSLNIYPPLMDFIMAGVAGLVSLFGISTATAAAGTLAWSTPILAALTCYPVYLVAKKMFRDDEKIGLLAALFYALFALLIMTTVFSNGTEYAFVGFMFAWMVYFMLKAFEEVDTSKSEGFKALFSNKTILKNTLIAGILFLVIALSWNQFRTVLTCLIALMAIQALIDRFRSKDISLTVGIYSVIILMGVLISAPYYISAGLWSALFSGALLAAVIAVVLVLVFAFTAKKSWALMIPALIVVAVAIIAVLAFAAPDLFSALIYGNSYYEGTLMSAIMASSHTSISAYAAYYGWLTMWLPVFVFLRMLYKYRKHADSKVYSFTMFFIFAMFFIGWYSTSNAVIAGIGFAVASSAAVIFAIRWVGLKDYFSGMKGGDLKSKAKKIAKPIPLAAVILGVVLILAPNIVYAIDASTSTNADGDSYFGGLGYTVSTTDSSSMNKLWASYSDEEKEGALVTWLSYSSDAAYKGGFDSVTDTIGGGSSAMANILLADGSAGATAGMAVRLMLTNDIADFKSVITSAGLDYDTIADYVNDPSFAILKVNSDIETYSGISSSLTGENAQYLVLINYLTTELSEPDLDSFYDAVCGVCGENISYVAVNGSMIPIYYGDSTYFSSIAYFNNYTLGSYGEVTEFYSVSTSTGYYSYTDAMYETFFWKSLIGPSADYYGITSSVSYLNALALSDGTVKAIPGYGLTNYSVAYWTVMYNADSDATLASDGWEEMNGYEAIALQNEQGGLINYLSGVVLLEYAESTGNTVSGNISYTTDSGTAAAEGIEVIVYTLMDYDTSGTIRYVPTSVATTNAHGEYKVVVPTDADYYVTYSSGATTTAGGTVIATFNAGEIDTDYVIGATTYSGTVSVNGEAYETDIYIKIVGATSGYTAECETSNGQFSFTGLIPDSYTVSVYNADGTAVTSTTANVVTGSNSGAVIALKTGTITVTVTDEYGASPDDGQIVATDTSNGYQFTADIEDGKAVLAVSASKYTLSATDGKIMISASSSITVSSGGSKTSTVTVYDSKTISVTGAPSGAAVTVEALGYMTVTTTGSVAVPVSGGSTGEQYTAYAVVGGTVYYGTGTGSSISMSSSTGYTISGNVTDSDGNAASGATVAFIASNGSTYIFTASSADDSKGDYSAVLPAGTYTLYAYDGDDSAYLGSYTVSADATKDIEMDEGRTLTMTLNYYTQLTSSGTKGIAFVDVTFATDDYSIVIKTNSSGKVYFYVPVNKAVTASIDGFNTTEFYCAAQSQEFSSGTGDSSSTWTLTSNPDKQGDSDTYVKQVTVSSTYEITLTLYRDSDVTYTFSGSKTIPVGRYTATIAGSTGYYFDGSVYVYPGQSGALDIDGIEVVTVTLNASVNDALTVTALENDDKETGSYYVDEDNALVYYVQVGFSYTFKALSASTGTETIAYGSVSNASSNVTIDLSNNAEVVTISGYVGAAADGTLTMEYGSVSIPFTVSSGEFEIEVPKGQAMTLSSEVSQTNSDRDYITYVYTSTVTLTSDAVVDGAVVNMASTTTSVKNTSLITEGSQSFSNGVGTVTIYVENDGDYANTYLLTAGSAWVLDKTYVLTVAAGATGSVTITGYYDEDFVGAGNENLSVVVTDISGNEIGTHVISGTGFTGTSTDTYVDVAGADDASNDASTTYEYLYAVTITNNDCYLKTAVVTATCDDADWTVTITDEDQYMVFASGSSFTVNGFGTTTLYVKVICSDGSSKAIPDVDISVSISGETLKTNSSAVSVSGSVATMSLSSLQVSLDTDNMEADGDNIYNTPSTVPTLFWVLLALCVLGLIFVVWTGSKRGVFTRRK